MYIISFDVASKSLALSIIYFNDNWKADLQKIKDDFYNDTKTKTTGKDVCNCALKYINQLENFVDTLIVPKIFDVVDLIPGQKLKDTNPLLRASRLNAYLSMVESTYIQYYPNEKYKVLLEYQMGPNDKSRAVCSQILYHFSQPDYGFKKTNTSEFVSGPKRNQYLVEIIGPSLKNKINLVKDKSHSFFMKKYTKSYDANKSHSKANFLHWIKVNKVEHMITNIKKANIDDISDSVTMTLAWLYIKSNLI
jgi:hypothetical protein